MPIAAKDPNKDECIADNILHLSSLVINLNKYQTNRNGRNHHLRPNRNNNWRVDAYVTPSRFLMLIKHAIHNSEQLKHAFITSSIWSQ